MKKATIALCVLLLLSFTACPPKKGRIIFIFCDVTTSLEGTERAEVAHMAADILNHLPPGTSYKVYPIQAETVAIAPINKDESEISTKDKDPELQRSLDESKQEWLVNELANISDKTNNTQHPGERKDDNRTCILNALNFADNQFKQFSAEKYDRELIIISDMLEECTQTSLKRPVNIKKPDITPELKLAGEFPEGNDFSNIKVAVITPVTLETYIKHASGKNPPMDDLKKFWRVVFSRCKVPDEADKNGMYSWSDGSVQTYLLAQNQ